MYMTYYTELWSGGQASFSSSQTRGWLTDLELVGETEIGWGSIMVHKAVVLTLCPSLAYVLHEVEDSKVIFTNITVQGFDIFKLVDWYLLVREGVSSQVGLPY